MYRYISTFIFCLFLLFSIFTIPSLATDAFCNAAGQQSNSPDISNPKIYTALGCMPIKIDQLMIWLLPYLFSIAGGISFCLILYGTFLLTTSQGDEKKISAARDTITSAITGLLVCIFSLFILRLIAIDILHIPGII